MFRLILKSAGLSTLVLGFAISTICVPRYVSGNTDPVQSMFSLPPNVVHILEQIQAQPVSVDDATQLLNREQSVSADSTFVPQVGMSCWHTLMPHDWHLCINDLGERSIFLMFPSSNTLKLGDVISRYGQPISFRVLGLDNDLIIWLFFRNKFEVKGHIAPYTPFKSFEEQGLRFKPEMEILTLVYNPLLTEENMLTEQHWTGFTRVAPHP